MKSNILNKKNSKIVNRNKQGNGKTANKKNKVNINIHPDIYNASSESKPYNDSKIHLTNHRKMYKSVKDINPNKKISNITNRNVQSNKVKEYENTLYKRSGDEKDLFNFNKYMGGNKRKIKIITINNDDSKNKSIKKSAYSKSVKAISFRNETSSKKNDENDNDNDDENSDDDDDYKKEDDFLYRTLYKASKDRKDLSNDNNKKLNNSVEKRQNYSELKINKINKNNGNNSQKPKEKKSIQNNGSEYLWKKQI